MRSLLVAAVVGLLVQAAAPQAPDQYFGIKIGADGELARYPKIVEYLQHLSKSTNRVKFEERGKTTMGNPYVLATISAPENLAKLNRLVEINRRLADPRGLTEAEAKRLAQEGRAFYFVYGTIHSTEVGNTQSLIEIAHRLATDGSPEIRQILDNVVVLLVPSQNPDGQYLVVDHWYKTKGTPYHADLSGPVPQVRRARRQPRLVHVHAAGNAAGPADPQRLQADHHARHAPDGVGRRAHLRAAVRRSLRSERPSDPRPGHQQRRAGDGRGAGVGREGRRGVAGPLRSVGPGAAVHGLPRPAAHPHRDRERQPRRSADQPERRADGTTGRTLELSAAVSQERLAPAQHRGLRQHGRVRRHGARREIPDDLAGELLQGTRRLGEPDRAAIRLRRAGGAARSVRDLRDARHSANRRSRDSPGEGAVQGRRQGLRGRFVGHPDGATVRRVRQDHARAAEVSGSASLSRRPAEAAL